MTRSSIDALTTSQLSDTRWKAENNTGSFVVFDTSLLSPSFSTGGFVNVGSYTFDASQITPESLFVNGVKTFTGRATNGGVLTVNAVPLTAVASNMDRT